MKTLVPSKIDCLLVSLLAILAIPVFFYRLGSPTVKDWDEARHAQNAFEIVKNKEWISITYDGKPDLLNLKPPLGAWLIAISFKLFGFHEFALRFWSAFFGTSTLLLLYFFGRNIKNRQVGALSSIMLLSDPHFVNFHAGRAGDYDVPMVFFITASLYLFWLSQKKESVLCWIGCAFACACAFLVKGVIGLFPFVIIVFYLGYLKFFKEKIFLKGTAWACLVFWILVVPWFAMRFLKEDGPLFFKMLVQDYGIRLFTGFESSPSGGSYFSLFAHGFGLILAASLIYSSYLAMKKGEKPGMFLVLWISLVFFLFEMAKTKYSWYILPIYPAMYLLVAYRAVDLLDAAKSRLPSSKIFLAIFFAFGVNLSISFADILQNPANDASLEELKSMSSELKKMDVIYIHAAECSQSLFFYLSIYSRELRKYENQAIKLNEREGLLITRHSPAFHELTQRKEYRVVKKMKYVALFAAADR